MITYQSTIDLSASADFTYENMRTYYEHYRVDWKQPKILEQIADLENWDILYNGSVVGAIRLAFDDDGCYLRDLQVDREFQNKGIGAEAINKCSDLARCRGSKILRLRVFKISPAIHLYERAGFVVDKEEDNFFYMSRDI